MVSSKRRKLKHVLAPTNPIPSSNPDDDELVNDLLAQLEARDSNEAAKVLHEVHEEQELPEDASKQNSKNRFKAREMRKVAARVTLQTTDDKEESERKKKEVEDEERAIRGICDARGLEMYEINPDGHCLFAAVADQLAFLSIIPTTVANYRTTRHAAADYIESHPDDFIPFLPSTEGEDGTETTESGLMNTRQFQKYCANIRDTGAWGGEPEILALANAFNVPIHVVQWGNPPVVAHSPSAPVRTASMDRVVQISYHRRMYGLGEHYNSLRPKRGDSD